MTLKIMKSLVNKDLKNSYLPYQSEFLSGYKTCKLIKPVEE